MECRNICEIKCYKKKVCEIERQVILYAVRKYATAMCFWRKCRKTNEYEWFITWDTKNRSSTHCSRCERPKKGMKIIRNLMILSLPPSHRSCCWFCFNSSSCWCSTRSTLYFTKRGAVLESTIQRLMGPTNSWRCWRLGKDGEQTGYLSL